jgi:branched-chain amino acid transport system permease protein
LIRKAAASSVGPAALLAAVGLLPFALNSYRASQFALVAVFLIAIAGVNIVTGYAGQISLGHGAFMAIGAYTTAILAGKHGFPYWTTIPLAGFVAGAAGLGFGLPALRLSGLYLALATFGVAVSTPAFAKHFESFTGGSTGLQFPIVGAPSGTGLSTNDWLYYLCWGVALISLAAAWLILRGRLGRAFKAIRDSEVAAASSGIDLALYKTLAFGISAAFAGVAGALFAIVSLSYVSPGAPDPIKLSLYLVIGAVIAGLGSLWGLVVGAVVIEFLSVGDLQGWLGISKSFPPDVFFGVVLVLVMILLPRGTAGVVTGVLRSPRGRGYTRVE